MKEDKGKGKKEWKYEAGPPSESVPKELLGVDGSFLTSQDDFMNEFDIKTILTHTELPLPPRPKSLPILYEDNTTGNPFEESFTGPTFHSEMFISPHTQLQLNMMDHKLSNELKTSHSSSLPSLPSFISSNDPSFSGRSSKRASRSGSLSSSLSNITNSNESVYGTAVRPKKPKTAYLFFMKDKRQEIKEKEPNLKFADVGKRIGELWKNISIEEKEKYEQMALNDKERFAKEGQHFKKLTGESFTSRGKSAYNLFMSENWQEVKDSFPDLRFADLSKILAERWNQLSTQEKNEYSEKAKQHKAAQSFPIRPLSRLGSDEDLTGELEKLKLRISQQKSI